MPPSPRAPWRRRVSLAVCLAAAAWSVAGGQSGTLNLSRDLVRLGIAAANMVPNQPTLDAGPLFRQGIEYARGHGIARVEADPGAYYFLSQQYPSVHVHIYGASGITVDLHGADLYLAHRQHPGLLFTDATDLTIQNFSMDYLHLPFTQVRVLAVDPPTRRLQFETLPGWQNPAALNPRMNPFGTDETIHVFIFRDGSPAFGFGRLTAVRPMGTSGFTFVDDGFPWDSAAVLERIRPGDIAVLTARGGGDPLIAYLVNRLTLRNVRIYSSGVNGFSGHGLSNSVIERVYVMPRPNTDRLISVNADGVTLDQPGPGNVIRLSRAIRALDDGFSPHVLVYGSSVSRVSSRTVRMRRQYGARFPPDSTEVVLQQPGDGVVLGTAIIVGQSPPPEAQPVAEELVDVTFDRDVPSLPEGTVFYATDPARRGNGLVLERNTVQDPVFARGITLWGLVGATLRGSYIRNTQMAAVFGTHRLFPFDWRSAPLEHLTIERNVIDAAMVNPGGGPLEKMAAIQLIGQRFDSQPMPTSPNRDVRITGNFIAESSRSAVRLQNVTGATITDNRIVNANVTPYIDGYWEDTFEPYRTEFQAPLVVKTSSGVTTGANPVSSGVARVALTDAGGRLLVAYAPDSEVLLQGPNAATFGQAALTDADGTRHALAVTTDGVDVIRVRLPAAAALGGAVIDISNGAIAAFATLFIDSADNFELPGTSLGLPHGLATTIAGGVLQVTWQPPAIGPRPTGYSLRFQSGDATVASFEVDAGAVFSTPLPPGTQGSFTVAVRARLGPRSGAWSLPRPFTIGTQAPGPVSNIRVEAGAVLRVTWLAPPAGPPPTSYRLDIRSGAALVAAFTVGAATVFEVPVPPGVAGAFTVTVTAFNGVLAGPPSAPAAFTIGAPPNPPANLLGLANGSSLALSWTPPSGGPPWSGLRLEVTGTLTTALSLPPGEVFTFPAVPPGTYTFRLSALNAAGASPPAGPVTLSFPSACAGPPNVPSAVTTGRNGRVLSVEWSPPASGPALTGYVLMVDGAFVGSFPTTTRSLQGTVGPGSYVLRVAATNPCGTGIPSTAATVVVP